jgi:hypothetical protein
LVYLDSPSNLSRFENVLCLKVLKIDRLLAWNWSAAHVGGDQPGDEGVCRSLIWKAMNTFPNVNGIHP